MLAHVRPFGFVEGTGLEQHGVAHADLADVVQERAELEGLEAILGITSFAGEHQRECRDPTAVTLGVVVLGFDRFGEAKQRLAVGNLELFVTLFEFFGAFLDDHVEQHLAALQFLLLTGNLAHQHALLFDEHEQFHALAHQRDQAAAFAGLGDEPNDRASMGGPIIELDGLIGAAHHRNAQRIGCVGDRGFEHRHTVELGRMMASDDHLWWSAADLVDRFDRRARRGDAEAEPAHQLGQLT